MNQENTIPSWRRFVSYAAVLLFLAALIGFLAINYSAGVIFLVSIAAAWVFYLIAVFIVNLFKRSGTGGRVLIGVLLVLFVCALPLVVFYSTARFYPQSAFILPIKAYHVQVEMIDGTTFKLQESIVLDHEWGDDSDDETVSLPAREVTSYGVGFLLNEITIAPLGMGADGSYSVRLPDGSTQTGNFCMEGTCPSAEVELLDFPKDAFYAAKMAYNLERFPYLDKETLRWTALSPDKGISLAYIRPPFNLVRILLTPFIGASTLNEWTVGVFGFLVSSVFMPIVKPVLTSLAQEPLKNLLKKRAPKKKGKK